MSRKLILAMTLTIVLIGLLGVAFGVQRVKASGTIYIRADGSIDPTTANISSVDNVTYTFTGNNYDFIVVERDNIVVDGAGYTLQGTGSGTGIFLSGRSNVTVKNVRITNFGYGVGLISSSDNKIIGNNIVNNDFHGVVLSDSSNNNSIARNNVANNWAGILLEWFSDNNSLTGNNITANEWYGIRLFSSPNNNITRNNITANTGDGIGLLGSSNNVLRDNVMAGNKYNFDVDGAELSHFMNDVDASNTVDGKHIVYLINQQNLMIDPQTYPDTGYLAVVSSTNITVQRLNMKNNGESVLFAYTNNSLIQNVATTHNYYGVGLFFSSNNSIIGSNITNNYDGIWLYYSSSYNSITGNSITANNGYGIWLRSSSNNEIFHNNFINNTHQVNSYNSVNVWDDGYPSGGNYWSNYAGVDLFSGPYQNETGSDGIGDTPYSIDRYPLMNPWAPIQTQFTLATLTTLYTVNFYVNGTIFYGNNLTTRFYSYSGTYQGEVTVWNGIPPANVSLSVNVTHPQGKPIETVELVLTDDQGRAISTVISFVVHRSHLMSRLGALEIRWVLGYPRPPIFLEIINIDAQWPYAPP